MNEDYERYRELSDFVDGLVLNYRSRNKAYIKYNAKLSGHVFEAPLVNKSQCDFDPDNIK